MRYVEPFAGSAALFFALKPSAGVLADANGALINTLKHVRDAPARIHEVVANIPRNEQTYYEKRALFNSLHGEGEHAAALFIYLNRNCFNGLWRTNQLGLFNVPYGGTEMGGNAPLALLVECAAALKRVRIEHQDFRVTIADAAKPGVFIYADPPYFTSTERTFVEYGLRSFGKKDLADLIELLEHSHGQGAVVALTYRDTDDLPTLPSHWCIERFDVTRNVGGFSGSRKRQAEVLITNRKHIERGSQ